MVLVKSRSIIDGSIEYCSIHDLLRDLAVRKAKEDNFLVVYSHPDDKQSIGGVRRLAVHNLDCEELVMSQNLHTLLCFYNKYMPNCSNQRLLKVVRTGTDTNIKIKLKMFEGLTQLRYLHLTGQSSDNHDQVCLEKVIGAIKFLHTLSMSLVLGDKPVKYPDCMWRINTLRHIDGLRPLEVPPSAKLTNLQTLPNVIIKEHWENELPHLPNLRRLTLSHEISQWRGLTAFLRTLEHLIDLKIHGDHDIPLDIFDMRGFPFYQNLQSLLLFNFCSTSPKEMSIDISMFPPHLTCLSIYNFKFSQDVMSILENLAWLKDLELSAIFTNRTISCSAEGFSQLEFLSLSGMTLLEDWKIEEGSMPILRELQISDCRQLCVPHGLQYLTGLQQLTWCYSGRGGEADEIVNLYKDVIPSISI
ncbi:disease resistance protein RPH8A-like [Carex rostrata]